ncbi:ArgS-related anticodon-binding protein NrtL [Streptomyces chilikensis]|uniref:ArgS-related anticodon-binding protein NrtL n=1 Tax=Streptomyces chilikensis TaxID=1194079 RepID=UPI0014094A6E|nr:DALR anticodon-binding domain-containing protein [Streptomyces chilikensis]
MTPVELSHTVLHAVRSAVDEGELAVAVPETVKVAPPGPGGCGDYATNVALRLAQPAGRPAAEVAEVLRARLLRAGGVRDVAVTGPGFLNISLAGDADAALVRRIRDEGMRYGHGDALAGRTVTLRVPREIRAEVVAEVTARLIGAQGGRACVTQVAHGESADIRPVPAPGDPAPLGPAAARWALLHPAPHDRPSLGGEHLAQREDNPLFRVRYAHARARAAARNAAQLGFTAEPGPMDTVAETPAGPMDTVAGIPAGPTDTVADTPADTPANAATAATAPALLRALADHPRVLAQAARAHAPDRLARHLVTVADATLEFLTHAAVLPTGEEKPSAAHRARLALAEAAGTVLAGGLTLLGIDAPEHL